jgi:hypothetical protein
MKALLSTMKKNKLKILLFASDKRCFNYLINIYRELARQGHEVFFLHTASERTKYPSINLDHFTYVSNIDYNPNSGVFSRSLNIPLPFTPDYLILSRERWHPEQGIIQEFKEGFNSKIALLEINTAVLRGYEVILEYHSRNQYPQSMIDLYFDHSDFSLQSRIEFTFQNSNRSLIVGNPKYDNLMEYRPTRESLQHFNQQYEIDPSKKNVLWYSTQTLGRNKCLNALERFSQRYNREYNIFYKAFPGEPYEPRYSSHFIKTPTKVEISIPGVKLIEGDTDLFYLSYMCDLHIGTISSVMYFPLVLSKKIVNLHNLSNSEFKATEINTLFEHNEDIASGQTGRACDFWVGVNNLKSTDELIELIGVDRLEKFKIDNKETRQIISRNTIDWDNEFKFLSIEPPNNKELLNLFDNFNDFNASERIVNELKKDSQNG